MGDQQILTPVEIKMPATHGTMKSITREKAFEHALHILVRHEKQAISSQHSRGKQLTQI